MLGAIWNQRHIDSIEVWHSLTNAINSLIAFQVSIVEGKGAEGRGSYFNSTGVIRDVMQNRKLSFEGKLTANLWY